MKLIVWKLAPLWVSLEIPNVLGQGMTLYSRSERPPFFFLHSHYWETLTDPEEWLP